MQSLEYQLEKLGDQLNKLENLPIPTFSETKDFSEAKNQTSGIGGFKNLGIMAIGGAVSPIVSNMINKFIPIGNLAPVMAGLFLKVAVKNDTASKIADGLIIASLSTFIGGLFAGKIGFSEGNEDEREAFSENRIGAVNFG